MTDYSDPSISKNYLWNIINIFKFKVSHAIDDVSQIIFYFS